MTSENNHIDKKLSIAYGAVLEGDLALDQLDDPIVPVLMRYKESGSAESDSEDRDKVWAEISKKLGPMAKVTPLSARSTFRYWAVAAAVLIAAFIGFYVVFDQPAERLLLETYAQSGEITLEDGSIVNLRPYSRLIQIDNSSSAQKYELEGEGYFEVIKIPDRTFTVTAGSGVVSVLGTTFTLSSWGESAQVYLKEGSVTFSHAVTSGSVTLQPGQSARTIGRGAISLDEEAREEEFTDWRSGQLIFNEKPLSEIIAELEQHFSIEVLIPAEVQDITLSGGLSLGSAQQSLDYLALTLEGAFEQRSEKEFSFIPSTD